MRAAKSAQQRKDELVKALQQARRELLDVAAAIPAEKRDKPFLGTWSVNDLVAHLAGWDYANLMAIRRILSGSLPDFYSQYDKDWRTFNAELVAEYKRPSLAETITVAEASRTALLAELEALPAEDLLRDYGVRSRGGRRVTVEMLLVAEASDEQVHLRQVRKFAAE